MFTGKKLFLFLFILYSFFYSFHTALSAEEYLKTNPKIVLQLGHLDEITSISFSPGGDYIATGSRDHTIKIWKFNEKAILETLEGHVTPVTSVEFTSDGKYLISVSEDKKVKFWDTFKWKEYKEKELEGYLFTISSDGKTVAIASEDNINFYAADTGEIIKTFEGDRVEFTCMAYTSSGSAGEYLICGKGNNILEIWYIGSGLKRDIKLDSQVIKIYSSASSKVFATLQAGNKINIWNSETLEIIDTLNGSCGAISGDGKVFASYSDNQIILWDMEKGEKIKFFDAGKGVTSLSFSPGGKLIAFGKEDRTLSICNTEGWDVTTFAGHYGKVNTVVPSPDGIYLAYGSREKNTINIWNMEKGMCEKQLEGYLVSYSGDGRELAASDGNGIRIYNTETWKCLKTVEGDSIWEISFSPDGKQFAYGYGEDGSKKVEIVDGETFEETKVFDNSAGYFEYSPDGKYFSDLESGSYTIYYTDSWESCSTVPGETMAFSSDSDFYSYKNGNNIVNTGETFNWSDLRTFTLNPGNILDIFYSNEGRYIASGNAYNRIDVIDSENFIETAVIRGNIGKINNLLKENSDLINFKDNSGRTLLHLAVLSGQKETSLLLIEKGVDINAVDSSGMTPLHYAAWNGLTEV